MGPFSVQESTKSGQCVLVRRAGQRLSARTLGHSTAARAAFHEGREASLPSLDAVRSPQYIADLAQAVAAPQADPTAGPAMPSLSTAALALGGLAVAAFLLKKIFDTPSRAYDQNVGQEYDAWTEEGVLECKQYGVLPYPAWCPPAHCSHSQRGLYPTLRDRSSTSVLAQALQPWLRLPCCEAAGMFRFPAHSHPFPSSSPMRRSRDNSHAVALPLGLQDGPFLLSCTSAPSLACYSCTNPLTPTPMLQTTGVSTSIWGTTTRRR